MIGRIGYVSPYPIEDQGNPPYWDIKPPVDNLYISLQTFNKPFTPKLVE